jgi:hypothetical protein
MQKTKSLLEAFGANAQSLTRRPLFAGNTVHCQHDVRTAGQTTPLDRRRSRSHAGPERQIPRDPQKTSARDKSQEPMHAEAQKHAAEHATPHRVLEEASELQLGDE